MTLLADWKKAEVVLHYIDKASKILDYKNLYIKCSMRTAFEEIYNIFLLNFDQIQKEFLIKFVWDTQNNPCIQTRDYGTIPIVISEELRPGFVSIIDNNPLNGHILFNIQNETQ